MIIQREDENYKKLKEFGITTNINVYASSFFGKFRVEPPVCIEGNLLGGLSIGAFSYISPTSTVDPHLIIGRYCSIAKNLISMADHKMYVSTSPVFYFDLIMNNMGFKLMPFQASDFKLKHSENPPAPPSVLPIEIGHDVWIGEGVFIKPGVKIGTGAIVGAKAVVTKDVPEYAVVVGVPAKIIKYRFSQKHIDMLLESKWWEYAPWHFKNAYIDDVEEFVDYVNQMRKYGVIPYKPNIVEFEAI